MIGIDESSDFLLYTQVMSIVSLSFVHVLTRTIIINSLWGHIGTKNKKQIYCRLFITCIKLRVFIRYFLMFCRVIKYNK